MGAGKSTIGRALAESFEYAFYDLDEEIEKKVSRPIRKIFDKEGELYFRKLERKTAKEFLDKKRCVVALGGGALQNQTLTTQIKNNALLIFIESPISVILQRIKGDENRPLLLNDKGLEKDSEKLKDELKTLYETRLPFYRQAAITINSDNYSSPGKAANALLQKIKEHAAN